MLGIIVLTVSGCSSTPVLKGNDSIKICIVSDDKYIEDVFTKNNVEEMNKYPDYVLAMVGSKNINPKEAERIIVKAKPLLTGAAIEYIYAVKKSNSYNLRIRFTVEGGRLFQQITKDNLGKRLAIMYKGRAISAPTIQATIARNAVIEGNFTLGECNEIFQDVFNTKDNIEVK